MNNEKNEYKSNEIISEGNQENINIDNEKYSKYKDIFNKRKNEEGFINNEDVNDILYEFGRKTTIEDTNELIKKAIIDNDSTNDNFVKLMESKDFESIIKSDKEQQPKKSLTNAQIYLLMLLLLITGSINTIANKLK